MTREEEIKATLKEYTAEYHCPVRGFKPADNDIRYLLASNEELQRRVDALQIYWDAVKWLEEVRRCYIELQLWMRPATDEFVQNFFNENFKIEQAAKREVELARDALDAADAEEK